MISTVFLGVYLERLFPQVSSPNHSVYIWRPMHTYSDEIHLRASMQTHAHLGRDQCPRFVFRHGRSVESSVGTTAALTVFIPFDGPSHEEDGALSSFGDLSRKYG